MKCLDKKRIKLKHGEALSLNERRMLQMVSFDLVCVLVWFSGLQLSEDLFRGMEAPCETWRPAVRPNQLHQYNHVDDVCYNEMFVFNQIGVKVDSSIPWTN